MEMGSEMEKTDFATLSVVNELPTSFPSQESEPFPDDLPGATIVRIGAPEDRRLIEGGGLVIDYQPSGSECVRRIVLGFNENGMWVEYRDPAAGDPTPA